VSVIVTAHLQAPEGTIAELEDFYGRTLGIAATAAASYQVGASTLAFSPGSGDPFYHYAMLVPGNRFEAARTWAQERVALLPFDDAGRPVAYFDSWDAYSVYFHDPVGNIVELIAHTGAAESSRTGEFDPAELVQLSEIGLVGEVHALVEGICSLGPEITDGDPDEPHELVFIGPPTSSLIISPADRGWLPLGRPAERHPVELTLLGDSAGEVIVGGHRIKQVQGPR
jgi:hypothetical protein